MTRTIKPSKTRTINPSKTCGNSFKMNPLVVFIGFLKKTFVMICKNQCND